MVFLMVFSLKELPDIIMDKFGSIIMMMLANKQFKFLRNNNQEKELNLDFLLIEEYLNKLQNFLSN